jgi:hypothetical protein
MDRPERRELLSGFMNRAPLNSPANGMAMALALCALVSASAHAVGLPCSYDFTVPPP